MLAQSFKTAAELDLTDVRYDALCKVLAFFEQEKVEYRHYDGMWGVPTEGEWFSMSTWIITHGCGTVACIGGWAAQLVDDRWVFGNHQEKDYWENHPRLRQLFCGSNTKKFASQITVEEAARCLRTYLETGVVDWNKAICLA
jgi:hypothetical protein